MFIIDAIFLNISHPIAVFLIVLLFVSAGAFLFLRNESKWSYLFGFNVAVIMIGFAFNSEYSLSQIDISRINESSFVNESVMTKLDSVINDKSFNKGKTTYSDISLAKRLVFLQDK